MKEQKIEDLMQQIENQIDKDIDAISNDTASTWLDHPIPSSKMRNRFLNTINQEKRYTLRRNILQIAACACIVILSATLLFLVNRFGVFQAPEYVEIRVPKAEKIRLALQDGSQVELNSDSYIRYPKNFSLFSRKVYVEGEAFFSIAKENSRTFTVQLNKLDVVVKGTQFNVKSYPGEKDVEVTLVTGAVELEDAQKQTFEMKPNQTVLYNIDAKKYQICNEKEENPVAWRDNSLDFYQTPLREIIKTLDRKFNRQFVAVDPTILDLRFTYSTKFTDIESIISDLEYVSKISFTKINDQEYRIEKKY